MGMCSKNFEIEKVWSAFQAWTERDTHIELIWIEKYGYVLLIWDEVSESFSASEVILTGEQLLEEVLEYLLTSFCIRDDIDTLHIRERDRKGYKAELAPYIEKIPEYQELFDEMIRKYGRFI